MTKTYSLAPMPKWYFADLTGRPAGAGKMLTYSSLTFTPKAVYSDPAGAHAWDIPPDGIDIDANGTQGPFYFEVDSENLDDNYFIQVFDADGNTLYNINNFTPPGGGGGSSTSAIELENLILNNVFYRADSPASISLDTFIAPGAHSGFAVDTASVPSIAGNKGDIRLIKNNTNAVDSLSIVNFTLGDVPFLPQNDVTPVSFLRYICTNTPAGETDKYVQFPITNKVQNLTQQTVTISLWGKYNSGTSTIKIYWKQFFGDGVGASSTNKQFIADVDLTTSWNRTIISSAVPNVSGKNIGACGNDALYLVVQYPLSAACSIDITKLSLYLGNVAPLQDYLLYDQIDATINAPRTGDIRVSINSFAPYGWVLMNDGVIANGDTITAPSGIPIARNNIDTFPLYDLIWNTVDNTLAPIYNSDGTVGTRGASSVADFEATKQLSLTKQLGRVLASQGLPSSGGSGTAWPVGKFQGEELHTLSIAEMPAHNHPGSNLTPHLTRIGNIPNPLGNAEFINSNVLNFLYNYLLNIDVSITSQGGDTGHNTIQPTSYSNVFMKL